MKRIGDAVEYVFDAIFGTLCLLLLYAVAMLLGCFGITLEASRRTGRCGPSEFPERGDDADAGAPVAGHGNA